MQQLCDHIHLKMSTVWLNEKKKKKDVAYTHFVS